MKAEQKSVPHFDPVTIVLETREEADFMWHLLNTSGSSLDSGFKSAGYAKGAPEDLHMAMWRALNETFHPEPRHKDC